MVKLKGSTLVETLIALIILVIISSILFVGVVRVENSFNNDLRIYAFAVFTAALNNQNRKPENSRTVTGYDSFLLIEETEIAENKLLLLKVEIITKEEKILFSGSRVHLHERTGDE